MADGLDPFIGSVLDELQCRTAVLWSQPEHRQNDIMRMRFRPGPCVDTFRQINWIDPAAFMSGRTQQLTGGTGDDALGHSETMCRQKTDGLLQVNAEFFRFLSFKFDLQTARLQHAAQSASRYKKRRIKPIKSLAGSDSTPKWITTVPNEFANSLQQRSGQLVQIVRL